MNVFVLYLLLLKAIMTTFSGLASVPIVQHDLVLHRHVLTDRQLTTSLAITRTTPGPMGLYVVSVGYFVDGIPGAIAGWLAMITPALLMIPLLEFVRRKAENPRFKSVLRCVVFASASGEEGGRCDPGRASLGSPQPAAQFVELASEQGEGEPEDGAGNFGSLADSNHA